MRIFSNYLPEVSAFGAGTGAVIAAVSTAAGREALAKVGQQQAVPAGLVICAVLLHLSKEIHTSCSIDISTEFVCTPKHSYETSGHLHHWQDCSKSRYI